MGIVIPLFDRTGDHCPLGDNPHDDAEPIPSAPDAIDAPVQGPITEAAAETIAALDAERAQQKAVARAYVDGIAARLGAVRHAWTLERDEQGQRFIWRCSCGDAVLVQPFDSPAPVDELVAHPRSFGQWRGER